MGFKIVKTKDKNFKSANAEKNIISIGSCRWANIFINQAALESSLLVNIANKDSVFSDDLSLDRIFLSLKTLETIANALRCSVPLLFSGANKVNIRSTGCLSAASKSMVRSKLEKNP